MEGHDRQRYEAWHRMMMMMITYNIVTELPCWHFASFESNKNFHFFSYDDLCHSEFKILVKKTYWSNFNLIVQLHRSRSHVYNGVSIVA